MKKCPHCHHEMTTDCYLKDVAQPICDYVIIQKKDDLKKVEHPLCVSICLHCGHVDMSIVIKPQ